MVRVGLAFKIDFLRAGGASVAVVIAEVILFVVTRPAHVVLADIIVLPTAQASATIVKRES